MSERQWGVHPGADDAKPVPASQALIVLGEGPLRGPFERSSQAEDVEPESARRSLGGRLLRPGLVAASLLLVGGLGWFGVSQMASEPQSPAPVGEASAPVADRSIRVVGGPAGTPTDARPAAPAASAPAPAAAPAAAPAPALRSVEERVAALGETQSAAVARLQERIDRADRVNSELVAQVARLQERIDRAERSGPAPAAGLGAGPGVGTPRQAAPIPAAPGANVAEAAPNEPVTAGSDLGDPRSGAANPPGSTMSTASVLPPPAAVPSGPIPPAAIPTQASARLPNSLPGFVIRDVYRGVALVQGRTGLYEVVPGQNLPGAGRVESIQRRGKDWVVVTSRGVISANELN